MPLISRDRSKLFALAATLLTAACADSTPTSMSEAQDEMRFQGDLVETNAVLGFAFLPPVAEADPLPQAFEPGYAPIVVICPVAIADCSFERPWERFTVAETGRDAIRMNPDDEHYIVNWNTSGASEIGPGDYVISVYVGGAAVGSAVVRLRTSSDGPFTIGSTVPLKFTIAPDIVPLADVSFGTHVPAERIDAVTHIVAAGRAVPNLGPLQIALPGSGPVAIFAIDGTGEIVVAGLVKASERVTLDARSTAAAAIRTLLPDRAFPDGVPSEHEVRSEARFDLAAAAVQGGLDVGLSFNQTDAAWSEVAAVAASLLRRPLPGLPANAVAALGLPGGSLVELSDDGPGGTNAVITNSSCIFVDAVSREAESAPDVILDEILLNPALCTFLLGLHRDPTTSTLEAVNGDLLFDIGQFGAAPPANLRLFLTIALEGLIQTVGVPAPGLAADLANLIVDVLKEQATSDFPQTATGAFAALRATITPAALLLALRTKGPTVLASLDQDLFAKWLGTMFARLDMALWAIERLPFVIDWMSADNVEDLAICQADNLLRDGPCEDDDPDDGDDEEMETDFKGLWRGTANCGPNDVRVVVILIGGGAPRSVGISLLKGSFVLDTTGRGDEIGGVLHFRVNDAGFVNQSEGTANFGGGGIVGEWDAGALPACTFDASRVS